MGKVIFILLLGIYSFPASGQWILKSTMDKFFGILNRGPSPAPQCLSEKIQEENETQLAQQCTLSLCGPPKDNPTTRITNYNFHRFIEPTSMASLEPLTSRIRSSVERRYNGFVKALEDSINSDELEEHIAGWKQKDYDFWARYSLEHRINFTIEKGLPLSQGVSYTLTISPGTPVAVVKAITAYAESKKRVIESSPLAGLENGLYSFDEAIELVDKYWKMIEKLFQKADTKKVYQNDIEQFEQLKRQFDQEELKSLDDINNFVKKWRLITSWFKDGNFFTVNYCDQQCKDSIKEIFSPPFLKDHLYGSPLRDAVKKMIDQEVAYCQSSLAMAFLRENELGEFTAIIPQAKNDFLNGVLASYSDISYAAFEQYLSKIKILPSVSKRSDKSIKEILDKNAREESGYSLSGILSMLQRHIVDQKPFLEPASSDCSNYSLAYEPSSYDYRDNEIHLSQFACTYHQYGKSTFAHEMAHALSYQFSSSRRSTHLSQESYNQFKKLRSCINQFYPKETRTREGDKIKTEEDMADIISYLVYPNSSFLRNCSYLMPANNGKSYDESNLLDTGLFDIYSSNTARIIIEAIYKGIELPLSCQRFLDKNKDQFQPIKCL